MIQMESERGSAMDGTLYDSQLKRLKQEALEIDKLEENEDDGQGNFQKFKRKRKAGFVG